VALVTGGGTGIGLGISTALASAGADVAIASRKPEHLEPAAERLRTAGARVMAIEANVREPESVARMVEQVVQQHGRLDVLVNNAAGNFYAPSASLSPNGWRAVVETDLYGTFYCCQAVYPVMKAQGGGRIVSVSMTLHYRGWPLMAHATWRSSLPSRSPWAAGEPRKTSVRWSRTSPVPPVTGLPERSWWWTGEPGSEAPHLPRSLRRGIRAQARGAETLPGDPLLGGSAG
jgi:NAD(P)-dependent dehydrogenase (short-subunit alcohol dehydrogenase family)